MNSWKDLESKPTGELIELFQGKTTTSQLRDEAFIALTYRFREDLLAKCEILCARFHHGPGIAEVITTNTFKAYAKKGNFVKSEGKGETIDDSFKIYLYGIARNELTNFYRQEERKRKGQYYDGSETIVTDLPRDLDLTHADIETKLRVKIIQDLPKSHRAIYLTYKAHEKKGCNLPEKLREELRAYCGGIDQGTVRTYKKEVNDMIALALKASKFTKLKS